MNLRPSNVASHVAHTAAPEFLGSRMGAVSVSGSCTACGMCLVTCPTGALRPAAKRPIVIASRCTSCLACVEICPVDAISESR